MQLCLFELEANKSDEQPICSEARDEDSTLSASTESQLGSLCPLMSQDNEIDIDVNDEPSVMSVGDGCGDILSQELRAMMANDDFSYGEHDNKLSFTMYSLFIPALDDGENFIAFGLSAAGLLDAKGCGIGYHIETTIKDQSQHLTPLMVTCWHQPVLHVPIALF